MSKLVPAATVAFSLACWGVAAPATADGAIVGLLSDQDAQVLSEFDTRRAAAITTAAAGSDEAAVGTLIQVLAGQALPFDAGYDPSGDWRCRFLKLGGVPPLTVYGWFSCRIFDDGAGWIFGKTTGSQLSMGRLYQLNEERLLYLGALHYTYETPIRFGDDPARNQIAVLTRLDDGRLRLEFPATLAEADFDILELAP
jgi:hypothetical protein